MRDDVRTLNRIWLAVCYGAAVAISSNGLANPILLAIDAWYLERMAWGPRAKSDQLPEWAMFTVFGLFMALVAWVLGEALFGRRSGIPVLVRVPVFLAVETIVSAAVALYIWWDFAT